MFEADLPCDLIQGYEAVCVDCTSQRDERLLVAHFADAL